LAGTQTKPQTKKKKKKKKKKEERNETHVDTDLTKEEPLNPGLYKQIGAAGFAE
jgi:hypothetical protein